MGGWELLQRGRDVLIKSLCFKDLNNLTVLQFARCPSKLCSLVDLFFFSSFQLLSYSCISQFFFSPEILLLNSKDVWIFQIQVEYLGSILKRVSFSTDLSLQRGLR